jgi:hypothetical protein
MFLLELIAIATISCVIALVVGAWLKRDEYDTEQRTRDLIKATDKADEEWLRLHPTQTEEERLFFRLFEADRSTRILDWADHNRERRS